ncbi:hypothetical protein OF83DRAFT_1195778 [Amylostereum chailletii]|nr:hypothetical protein OF83DRAFT_1195778 [Amylostereum chailletii]
MAGAALMIERKRNDSWRLNMDVLEKDERDSAVTDLLNDDVPAIRPLPKVTDAGGEDAETSPGTGLLPHRATMEGYSGYGGSWLTGNMSRPTGRIARTAQFRIPDTTKAYLCRTACFPRQRSKKGGLYQIDCLLFKTGYGKLITPAERSGALPQVCQTPLWWHWPTRQTLAPGSKEPICRSALHECARIEPLTRRLVAWDSEAGDAAVVREFKAARIERILKKRLWITKEWALHPTSVVVGRIVVHGVAEKAEVAALKQTPAPTRGVPRIAPFILTSILYIPLNPPQTEARRVTFIVWYPSRGRAPVKVRTSVEADVQPALYPQNTTSRHQSVRCSSRPLFHRPL